MSMWGSNPVMEEKEGLFGKPNELTKKIFGPPPPGIFGRPQPSEKEEPVPPPEEEEPLDVEEEE